MSEEKLVYLQLLQEPINRMATASAIFKGFAATIVAGITLVDYEKVNICVLFLSFLPVFAFAIMDVYYLRLERKFRYLFEQVRLNKHAVDFSMELAETSDEISCAKAGVWNCIISPSISFFYPPMFVILGIVFVMKYNCKI